MILVADRERERERERERDREREAVNYGSPTLYLNYIAVSRQSNKTLFRLPSTASRSD
jgi:hypothetical protein